MAAPQATIRSIQTAPVSLQANPNLAVRGSRGSHAHSDFLLIRIEAETGSGATVEGFGEVSATPLWSGEDGGSADYFIRTLLSPLLIDAPLTPVGALEAAMDKALAGNVFTKAGISIALWDCWAKLLGVPLVVALGGPYRDEVPIKLSLSGDGEHLLNTYNAATALGVGAFKVKVGVGGVPADLARVARVREWVGPDAFLGVDANGGWSRGEAASAAVRLRDYGIDFIEQPCAPHDLGGLREVRQFGMPVIADESVFTMPDLIRVIREEAADVISVYVGKAGGPGRAVDQGRLATAFGLGTILGSNGELGIGAAAQLHVACALPKLTTDIPNDIIGALYYTEDILETPLDSNGRRVKLGDGVGLGVRPRADLMSVFR
jgi:L-alanine-DL-glutamate epimerase-like enolase superfamily enzyme